MNQQRLTGIVLALLAAASFGMVPLFTIPLLAAGASPQTVLTYRFFIASLAMALVLAVRKDSFLLSMADAGKIAGLGTMYFLTVLCYTWSLRFLPGGIAATIQFLYPVMVIAIMAVFFHKHFHWYTIVAVILAVAGVALLSFEPAGPNYSKTDILFGVLLSLLTGLFNALYFVGIQAAKIPHAEGFVLTFYIMVSGFLCCFATGLATGDLQWIGEPVLLLTVFFLAMITAVLSNLSLILAVKRIGATLSSILGVMEPLVALVIGVLAFDEAFTTRIAVGVVLVIAAVLLAICAPVVIQRRKAIGYGTTD